MIDSVEMLVVVWVVLFFVESKNCRWHSCGVQQALTLCITTLATDAMLIKRLKEL